MPRPTARTLTTGDAARAIGVSTKSIANWIASGHLAAWMTPGNHARIREDELRRFAEARGIELDLSAADTDQAAE